MSSDIDAYHKKQTSEDRSIVDVLRREIELGLTEAESKVWHSAPVWFLDGNPTVGYSKLKGRIRLMFWSGADFDEKNLEPGTGKFKDAHIDYTSPDQINKPDIARWLEKSKTIRWNYRDIVKNKGILKKF